MNVGTLEEGNQFIIDKLKSEQPFFISRLGIGAETYGTYNYYKYNMFYNYPGSLSNNAGIYSEGVFDIKTYYYFYNQAIKNSDALATFPKSILEEQKFFIYQYKLNKIHNRVVEPHHLIYNDIVPWTHQLLGKRILIISPFADSFITQLKNNFEIFPGKRVFLKGQDFVFYKGYNTSAGNHLHSSWIETFQLMKEDIKKLEFDVALISCGGYGLLLGNYIKELGKGAIYVGGGLQLQFGVMGNRWKDISMFQQGQKWIRPLPSELPPNPERVEGNCYG